MRNEPVLEIDDIQGNVLSGFRLPFQKMMAFAVKDESLTGSFLDYLIPQITMSNDVIVYHSLRKANAKRFKAFALESYALMNPLKVCWINIAFGNTLLAKFDITASSIDSSFKVGAHNRSLFLGDPRDKKNEGNARNWKIGSPDKQADIFLVLAADTMQVLSQKSSEVKAKAEECGIQLLYDEMGIRLPGNIEHFGFNDGISQPAVRGYTDNDNTFLAPRMVVEGNEQDNQPEYAEPGKQLIWPGQFVFGYQKQSPSHFRDPLEPKEIEKNEFLKNGSFLVFRRLKQDVKGFYSATKLMFDQLNTNGNTHAGTYEDFLAKLVGRQKDGAPLLNPSASGDDTMINNFNYKAATPAFMLNNDRKLDAVAGDPTGGKCPMFAHIRKVNPRDMHTDQGSETNTATFRFLRRGIPFGPPYDHQDENAAVNAEERGLLFLSYQTSIAGQFELISNKWMNLDSRPEKPAGHDMIVGQNNEDDAENERWILFTTTSGQQVKVKTMASFVIPTGGGYFFTPSLKTLKRIRESLRVT